MNTQRLYKNERLRLRRDFKNLFNDKGRAVSSYFVLVYKENGLDHCRIGISVKKKFGKAHLRNKVRRYIKEVYRKNKEDFPFGYDILFIPRKGLSDCFKNVNYHDIENMIFNVVGKIK
ncbi:ribonuclease P protein component [Oceanotoga sp. DSM 15011]|uniref:Ribonuclease P protein component n=1 Tax=Oceanotoga teriensis TaxID=515440 RepID=A0AA45HJI8_9BACT|nr:MULTISPECIES: ribonuclease P protein component [Oceanotoga]PWJ95960.1 ribonuclease P protein component [Oceanotoga teriensis]UYP00817.1 ribonuclease P protein component [Oceanotoga sp. DSM 15011]